MMSNSDCYDDIRKEGDELPDLKPKFSFKNWDKNLSEAEACDLRQSCGWEREVGEACESSQASDRHKQDGLDFKNSNLVFFPSLPAYKPINDVIIPHHLLETDEEDIPEEVFNRDDHFAGLYFPYVKPFDDEEPEYLNDIPVFGPIEVGEELDVISMLSNSNNGRDYLVRNDGERVLVESLRGKYVLVCCFFVPMLAESYEADKCLDIIAAYTQLIVERRDEVQMVMVAKMRRDWANHDDEPHFQHFFSAFPNCLAIPFWDSQSRDCVAKSLELLSSWTTIVIVDPKQTVLQVGSSTGSLFKRHGALAFPFTDERINSLSMEDRELWLRIMNRGPENTLPTLDELLCLNTSDYLCSSDENGCISVLDLSNKVVGLYLCYDGGYLATINFFHRKCKAKGLEFEIVLVYLPFVGTVKRLQSRVNEALVKHEISWWVLPFNDKVSRRLSRVGDAHHDNLIILGPNSSFAELLGLEVMCCYGIRGYPFARECIVDGKLAKLRSITLESVLIISEEEHNNYVLDKDGDRVPVSELLGRNIILYLDYLNPPLCGEVIYDQLVNWYPELKAKDPEFEVVFISYDVPGEQVHERYYKMQWLSVPFPSGHVNINQLFLDWEDKYPKFIAFGKDGLLRSRCADFHLEADGIDAFPFEGYLRKEMFSDFNELDHFFYYDR